MKNPIAFLLCVSSLYFSCANTPKRAAVATEVKIMPYMTKDTVMPFHGLWISKQYWDTLNATKSPRKSQEYGSIIWFPRKSLQTYVRGDLHSATEGMLVKDGYSFALCSADSNIHAYIIQLKHKKLMIDGVVYEKAETDKNDSMSISKAIGETLFDGEYYTLFPQNDSMPNEISFFNGKTVDGIGDYTTFNVRYDYMDAGLDVDEITLTNEDGKSVTYGFKFNGVDINLYKLKFLQYDSIEKRPLKVKFGKLKYTLTPLIGGGGCD